MNPELVLEGDYVKSFTGHMIVKRAAEVYFVIKNRMTRGERRPNATPSSDELRDWLVSRFDPPTRQTIQCANSDIMAGLELSLEHRV